MKKADLQRLVVIGIFVLLVLLIFNLLNIFNLKQQLEGKIIEIKELSRPANLELIVIKTTDCIDCFDIDKIVEKIKSANVNITKEIIFDTALSEDNKAIKELVDKYGIEKLPTIILMGEINKISIQNFKQVADTLIFNGVTPPYVDAKTKNVIGKVEAIVITDKNCKVCYNLSTIIQILQQKGIIFSTVKLLDYKDNEAREFINNFNIERVPALFLSDDIEVYQVWQQLKNTFTFKEGYYFIESPAPYVEIETGRTRGLVDLIMLIDDSCQECYDVTIHKRILARFGLAISEEKTIDIISLEGKQLINKYNITKVPTIILRGDLSVYENLASVWPQVGTIETDGSYVFRELNAMGRGVVYKDLSTGEIVG